MFAHTTVEAPNAGATSRAAAISAPSVEMPATKTTTSAKPQASRRSRPRAHPVSPAAYCTIEASISHSTGARSSVKTVPPRSARREPPRALRRQRLQLRGTGASRRRLGA